MESLYHQQYVASSFVIDGKEFDQAYPFPFTKVVFSNKEIVIEESKKKSTSIKIEEIKDIKVDARKRFDGGLYSDISILHWRFIATIMIETIDGKYYLLSNGSMLIIFALHSFCKKAGIMFIDEHEIEKALTQVNIKQSTFDVECEIVKVLMPISKNLAFISEDIHDNKNCVS